MDTITTGDGVELALYDLGGDGPDLLLAHATGFHGRVWLPIAEQLQSRFHCWSFDERGHGDSTSPPDGNFDWHAFGDDALAVVDALGLERPVAAGHSAGGALLLLAEQVRPGTFAALWCFEPVIFPVDDPPGPNLENPLAAGALRRREVFDSRDAAFANYASKPPFSGLDPEALRAYVDHGFDDLDDGTVRLKCRGADESKTYSMASSHRAFRGLPAVGCPVTVACGENTTAFGPTMIRAVAERIPQGRAEVMPGLTHFGPLEDPARVAESIASALREEP